jgi:hypothetical protein
VSIRKGALANALENVVAVVESVQLGACGGEVRLTSFCSRHVKRLPAWFTCSVWAESAPAWPFTFSHEPYRLSKLWFSS